MTDNELKKLNRTELLELLVEQSKRIDELQSRLDEAEAKLAERQILLDKAGSIAEASLRLNGVFRRRRRLRSSIWKTSGGSAENRSRSAPVWRRRAKRKPGPCC